MSDYLEENPHKVKNAAYYRRQMKELERENAELKQQNTLLSGVFSREEELQAHITELKRIIAENKFQIPFGYWHVGKTDEESDFFIHSESGDVSCPTCVKLYASPVFIPEWIELLGYAHQCDDYNCSVISTDKDEYGDKTVAIYKIKDTK